jgi:integrase
MSARNRNLGLRKRCRCKRRDWPKCPHGWHMNFKQKGGPAYRLSLDKEIGRHVDTKTEAGAEAERIRTAIRNGTFRRPDGPVPSMESEVTLEQYIRRDWLVTSVQNLKASTLYFYVDNLENHILPLLGQRAVTGITRKDCRQLVTTARGKGLKISTVRGIVRTLSVVLSLAVEDEHLPANPALSMRKYLRRGDEQDPKVDPFTREEAALLVTISREHFPEWHAWVLCALRTGLRLSELLAVQWGDVDWRGRFIYVQRGFVRGKLTSPKNHQVRRVDLSPELRTVLRLWRRQQSQKWFSLGVLRPEWVFPTAIGTAMDESNVRKRFSAILDKAGLHRRGPHQMRHTFASLLLLTGEPITYVSKQAGPPGCGYHAQGVCALAAGHDRP